MSARVFAALAVLLLAGCSADRLNLERTAAKLSVDTITIGPAFCVIPHYYDGIACVPLPVPR